VRITAALAFDNRAPLRTEAIEISEPASDEVVVRIVASGICHTDLTVLDHSPLPWPAVLGHEGAGRVTAIGSSVTTVGVGDPVATTFNSCGICVNCAQGFPAQCLNFTAVNMSGGRRTDGSCSHSIEGKPVFAAFLGQSSFATHAVMKARSVVRIPEDFPLELAAPLGCGIQTGAGGVLNTLRPRPGSSIAIFGAGAVGLSALMAAKAAGCTTLVAIDRSASRLKLANELGATHTFEAKDDVANAIRSVSGGGVNYSIEAAGAPSAMQQAIESLAVRGSALLLGIAPGTRISIDPMMLQRQSLTVKGMMMTEGTPRVFIPKLIELFRAGLLPYDRLVRYYDFSDINSAIADARSGVAIKPIIRMA
jgi:aryl-alcohol dehydrogenase